VEKWSTGVMEEWSNAAVQCLKYWCSLPVTQLSAYICVNLRVGFVFLTRVHSCKFAVLYSCAFVVPIRG